MRITLEEPVLLQRFPKVVQCWSQREKGKGKLRPDGVPENQPIEDIRQISFKFHDLPNH